MAVRADPIAEAAAAARRGGLIVFPTDTVYGLGSTPGDPVAIERIFRAKRRPSDLALALLVSSVLDARTVAALDDRAERLAAECWPGALTLVLPRAEASVAWDLGGDRDTVAVRMPHHPLALALLAASGPLAVTSANRSGLPPATTCDELTAAFGDDVDCYLCQDDPLRGLASTVLDLAHDPPAILRAGAVDREALARFLGSKEPLLDSPISP